MKSKKQLAKRDNAGRWKPGQSGNPGGRVRDEIQIPKTTIVTATVLELFREKLLGQEPPPDEPAGSRQFKDAVWKRVLSPTVSGAMTLDKIQERLEGKVRDEIDLNVKDDFAEIIRKARLRAAQQVLTPIPPAQLTNGGAE